MVRVPQAKRSKVAVGDAATFFAGPTIATPRTTVGADVVKVETPNLMRERIRVEGRSEIRGDVMRGGVARAETPIRLSMLEQVIVKKGGQ